MPGERIPPADVVQALADRIHAPVGVVVVYLLLQGIRAATSPGEAAARARQPAAAQPEVGLLVAALCLHASSTCASSL